MTKAEAGMAVRRQVARPRLDATVSDDAGGSDPHAAILESPDVLVVGGGAGGLSAAIAAAEKGADVLVLDERAVPGGQYFKQRSGQDAPLDRQQSKGRALIERAGASGARILDEAEVWGAFSGPVLHATQRDAPVIVRPKALIVATGAYERPRFVPGWDLPGVMTSGAGQTLWRSYQTLPGKRIALLGNGPLNLQVAGELRRGGAEIVLVAEAAAAPWLKFALVAAMLFSSPGLTFSGLAMMLRLIRSGTPIRFNSVVEEIRQGESCLEFDLSGPGRARSTWTADAICMNYGFHPQNEILRLLGSEFDYDPVRSQLVCRRTENCETTMPGIFAVGDCCGMGGAHAAMGEGRIAGRAAAARALARDYSPDRKAQRQLERQRRFQIALWNLFASRGQLYEDIDQHALICRCEGLSRVDIDGPASEPGTEIGGLKRATRAGMGRCQGRYCAQVLAPHIAGLLKRKVCERSFFAPRIPIKPVEISAILAADEAIRVDD